MELEASERTIENHPAGKREAMTEPYGPEALAAKRKEKLRRVK